MDPIELPTPPPLPPGPVPQTWDPLTEDGRARERHHRLAVLHGACEQCTDSPDGPTWHQLLADLAQPQPEEPDDVDRFWRTPEGEMASFVHGRLRVHDRPAFLAWAQSNFVAVGDAFAYTVTVAGAPWTRALFWFQGDDLHLEASSIDRYLHLELVFEHLWPAVFRGRRIVSPLDEALDAPFRPLWPAPPAEASAFTRLVPPHHRPAQTFPPTARRGADGAACPLGTIEAVRA